jgi:ech hydrogenase subunit D
MIEEQKIVEVTTSDLVAKVRDMFVEQYRLVQIGCTKLHDRTEINYSFDKNYQFINLRLILKDDKVEIPSVSSVYFPALFYENEIHDLFGLNISGIILDFKGTFYETKEKFAFATCPPKVEVVQRPAVVADPKATAPAKGDK